MSTLLSITRAAVPKVDNGYPKFFTLGSSGGCTGEDELISITDIESRDVYKYLDDREKK